ncbi:hypothetical protein M2272_004787 [Mycobacterium frederiksbergense]|uniref:WXG100 family type VII secretion target n=1 Tax=Mycolicibacterium frederiksbergense TaxID=117567 RepID=A0ABT6L599_9MYCO|nr:hypothetical protein [Mycolicibacterium frederiksbergense]MDH6198128.1 hypothetical protein [Mycolicibacterium frederiksbergense]
MPLPLSELKDWYSEIGDLAKATREAVGNHSKAAEFYRSLNTASTWEGEGGDAARAAMEATAQNHDATAENLRNAAGGMEDAAHDAEDISKKVKDILDYAAEQPAVEINESTNQVISPDTSHLTEEAAEKVASKVAGLESDIAAVLADADLVDADLARDIATATGTTPPDVNGGASDGRAKPDDPAATAQRYDQSGQRAKDQAVVDKANAEGRTSTSPGMVGQPSHLTGEEADAAARLRDYKTITEPNSHTAIHGGEKARRLAAERLDDHRMSQFTGPLAKDTVVGGDARTRAQTRLDMQHALENGQLAAHPGFMTPDDATRLMDRLEVEGRARVLTQITNDLEHFGVSHDGAKAAVEEIKNGKSPDQVIKEATGGLATQASNLGEGAKAHGRAMPGGEHWGKAPVWSHADAEALKGFGSKLGNFGTAIDAVITVNDMLHGAPVGEELAEFGGRTGGTMLGGWAAGAAWGSLVGPEGTLVVGFLGAMAGGIWGEKAVDWMMGK